MDFKALKVIRVSLDCLVRLDPVVLQREELQDHRDPWEQQDFQVLLVQLVRVADLVQLVSLVKLADLVILVQVGRLVPLDPEVHQAQRDFQAILVHLGSLDSQDLRDSLEHSEILEAQDLQVQQVLLALLEVVAVQDSKVFQD